MGVTTARKDTEMPVDPWMSLGDAARALGITRHTVLNRIVAGELKGTVAAGRTLVSRESVAAMKAAKAAK